MKMTFLKLFLICTFKDPNLAEKFKKIDRKSFKKIELHGVHGVRFFQVCLEEQVEKLMTGYYLIDFQYDWIGL